MSGIQVDASELGKLAADARGAGARVGAKAAAVLRKAAYDVEAGAKGRAPVDTGNLRNSIFTTITGDGRSGTMTAEVGPSAEYGIFQELGTSRMGPQPYLAPAFDAVLPGLTEVVAQLGAEILD